MSDERTKLELFEIVRQEVRQALSAVFVKSIIDRDERIAELEARLDPGSLSKFTRPHTALVERLRDSSQPWGDGDPCYMVLRQEAARVIEHLEQELIDNTRELVNDSQDDALEYERQIKELTPDAKRYRALREQCDRTKRFHSRLPRISVPFEPDAGYATPEALDAAVDAVMPPEPPQ